MKVSIKGLVFTGFAAAILSANAMAADENIVTSKSFTEHTYQHKIHGGENYTGKAVIAGTTDGVEQYRDITSSFDSTTFGNNTTNLVTEGAVNSAIAAAANVDNFVVNNVTDTATNKAPSVNAVKEALANKQNLDTGNAYVVSKNGTWEAMTSAVTAGNANTISVSSGTNGAAVVSAVTSAVVEDGTALTTGGQVYTYVNSAIDSALNSGIADDNYVTATYDTDSHITTIGLDTTQITDATEYANSGLTTNSDNLITEGAVKAALTDTANVGNGVFTVSINGTSQTFSANQATNTSITVEGLEVASNKAEAIIESGVGSNIADSTAYASTKAVYDYVQSVTGGTTIPKKATSMCTDSIPCALVYESTGAHWRTMATDSHAGGVLADACSAADTTCSAGTCNTTNNVCVEGA